MDLFRNSKIDGAWYSIASKDREKIWQKPAKDKQSDIHVSRDPDDDKFMRYIKSGYQLAWGNDVDKVAQLYLSQPIYDLLAEDGSLSSRVFTLFSAPAKEHVKRMSVSSSCTDVYVYDQNNQLCSAIIGSEIKGSNENVVCSVKGEVKTVVLDDENYTIKVVSIDDGFMSCTIEEENENGEIVYSATVPYR